MTTPLGWEHTALQKISLSLRTGPFGSQLKASEYASGPGAVPVVMPADIMDGSIRTARIARIPAHKASQLRQHALQTGDLLFPRRGDLGRIGLVTEQESGWICGTGCLKMRPGPRAHSEFLAQLLASVPVRKWLDDNAVGQTMLNLNTEIIGSLPVSLPPIPEQRKIAEILRAWDDAIDKTLALRRLADARRSELAERVLVPSDGARRKLAELTRPIKTRNSAAVLGRESVMGVSNRSGLVPMREQTIAADISRYQILPPRAFAYNPMRINVGSIAMSRSEAHVLVSPDYVLFQCDERELLPEYLDHVLRTRWWLHKVNAGASGSVRTRTYYDDLAAISIAAPPIAEQDNVSRAFDGLEREIQLLQRKAELLRTQKRGLMQKLLTGQVRVNVTAEIEPGGLSDD